jgi:hypothetical protein
VNTRSRKDANEEHECAVRPSIRGVQRVVNANERFTGMVVMFEVFGGHRMAVLEPRLSL